jgi:hypothetical protein
LDVAFNKILNEEFPEKNGFYKKCKIIGLSSEIVATCPQCLEKIKKSIHRPVAKSCCRYNMLENFDKTKNNEILIISSCETIGEGIDTKNANMCVFVDPKSSYVSIMQNIGRIVRKNNERPLSTILIPCWVDREKYFNCNGDKEKCDEAMREDLGAQGNFNSILNVMSALRQEDEELYDICLHYPDTYSPQEIETNLKKQGFIIKEPIGEGNLIENVEYLLDKEIDCEEYEDLIDEEMLMQIATNHGVNIEVHTNSLETPIEKYISEDISEDEDEDELEKLEKPTKTHPKKTIRLYKEINEETEEPIYSPIVEKKGENEKKQSTKQVLEPNRNKRVNVKVHTNPDVKVLWNISCDVDGLKDVCSCVIDCEVVDNWYEKLEELKRFIDENERRPISKFQNEKQLGLWSRYQLSNYEKNIYSMKNQEKYNLWTEFLKKYGDYFKSLDDIWYDNFETLKLFINENEKRPNVDSIKIKEKKIGCWLCRQNANYENKQKTMKNVEKYDLWTQFLKDYEKYFKSIDELWYKNFEEIKSFIDINCRRPSTYSENVRESLLGRWIDTQKHNYKTKIHSMNDVEKYNSWTQFLEDYKKYFKTPNEIWYEKFEESKKFINENCKRPSHASIDGYEKEIGMWIHHQNNNYKSKKNSMKEKDKYDLWTQFLNDYEEYFKSSDEKWHEKFENLKQFIEKYDKCPVAESKNDYEKNLGHWLQNQKNCYKKKIQSMKDKIKYDLWTKFLKDYEEYFKSDSEIWYQKFDELKKYIRDENKFPNIKTKLGAWINTQNDNYKNKKQSMKDEIKYELWNSFRDEHKDYFKSNDEIWYDKFDDAKQYICDNKKKPSRTSKNEYEKNIGGWINNQNNNYKIKKQAMSDPEKYKLWTNFLIENKHILNLREDIVDYSAIEEESAEEELTSNITTSLEMKEEDSDDEDWNFTILKKSAELQRQKIWPKSKTQKHRNATECELTKYHKKYITMRSDNLAQHFKTNRDEFIEYHRVRDENLETFDQQDRPHERIIAELNKIKTRRQKIVVDMGCGLAKISEHFKNDKRFEFINYDHVSTSENIIECDISHMPLEEDSVEICIMSMALWGSNCQEYIREAHRVLETGGKLYVIDSTKRWSNTDENGLIVEGTEGDKLKNILVETKFQIINQCLDKWCMFICEK